MSRAQPREDLRSLDGYHSTQRDVSVRLNTNESPYAPPEAFLEQWTAAMRAAPFNRYPDRSAQALRQAIGESLGQPAERVFAANGSNEVLQTLLLAYGGPRRQALVFEPTYALHAHLARVTATGVIERDRTDDFHIDVDRATEVVLETRPSIVFVCSPNNPTGTIEPMEAVRSLSVAVDAVDGVLVVDEAYGEFAEHSAVSLVDDRRSLVVVRTYSKVWSLAGLRLGFCIAPGWLVQELEKVVLPYHLSSVTQLAGVLALNFRDEMQQRVAKLLEQRAVLAAALARLPGITAFPSGANFILFRIAGDAQAVWEALAVRGVLVRDFSHWPRVEGCLRVTVGTPDENAAFLTALAETLNELGIRD